MDRRSSGRVFSYSQVVGGSVLGGGSKDHKLVFVVEEDVAWARFSAIFVGVVANVGSAYIMQEILDKEGFFTIKFTPLEANLCLLEDRER